MSLRRILLVVGTAAAFGVLAALLKGQDSAGRSGVDQVRSAVGNLSSPWLLVACVAGARTPRIGRAAMLGLLATMSALLGFYALTAVVVDLGGHGFVDNLRLELTANLGYLQAGLVIGPAFGALGGWWRRTRSVRASIVVGVLLMAEPLVLAVMGAVDSGGAITSGRLPLVIRLVPGWGLSASAGTIRIAVYVAEFLLGLALVVVVWRRSPKGLRADGVALDA